MSDYVLLSEDGDIARIGLARPEKRNALSAEMLLQLNAIAREVSERSHIRAVLVYAEGDHFSVGADLGMLTTQETASLVERRKEAEFGGQMLRSLREIRQPTIAAVQGVATGGGACIATACDFRIAAEDARMGYGEINMGMNLMWHALPHCVQLVGPARAKRLILSGELFAADTLERWGFVDEVCPREQLEPTALRWARHYAALPPMAAQMIKRSVNQYAGALDNAIMHADSDQWLLATESGDFKEAVSAFLQKREPRFTGD